MKALQIWLDQEKGRAKSLAALLSVGEPALSRVKSGHRKVPQDWMQTIEKFTQGVLTVEGMVATQSRGKLQERKRRAKARASHAQ